MLSLSRRLRPASIAAVTFRVPTYASGHASGSGHASAAVAQLRASCLGRAWLSTRPDEGEAQASVAAPPKTLTEKFLSFFARENTVAGDNYNRCVVCLCYSNCLGGSCVCSGGTVVWSHLRV